MSSIVDELVTALTAMQTAASFQCAARNTLPHDTLALEADAKLQHARELAKAVLEKVGTIARPV